MKKFSIFMFLVLVGGIVAGCGDSSEKGAVDKATEIENQTKAAGGADQKP